MKKARLAGAILALALPAAAQDYSDGRIRLVEGRTTLQRASEAGAEEAFPNLPFVPGDRVWTDEGARIEFQFGPQVVRVDQRSKLDYMEHEGRGAGMITLRLWSGAVFVRSRDGKGAPDIAIETPGGLVEARGNTALRVDLVFGEARLSVYDGQASIDNGERRVKVAAGEQTVARRGEDPERPEPIDRRDGDGFARWNDDRDREGAWANDEHLPEEVAPYGPELAHNGTWHVDTQFGYVWQPYVVSGWRPYTNGRWVWSPYGWTWSPNESWGWAPSHYGRWSFSTSLGWYWIPGRVWTPASVTWSVGGDYVGWCPQGFERGYVVPRGGGSVWNYTRRADLSSRDVARRRVAVPDADVQALRVVEHGYHVDRTVRTVEGDRALPRVQVRPTPGDTIYELRSDPATTIPFPTPRHHYASEEERRQKDSADRATAGSLGTAAGRSAQQDEQRRRDTNAEVHTQGKDAKPSGGSPPAGAVAGGVSESADRERGTSRERAVERTPDRDVMRRVFGPLSGAKTKERDSDTGGSPDSARARPHETPQKDSPSHTESKPRDDAKKRDDSSSKSDTARKKN